jgi:hypothetical protein
LISHFHYLVADKIYTHHKNVKMNNKLLFTLCRTCSENQQQKPCQHNDEERSLTGKWVT